MAWATLLVLLLGLAEARTCLAAVTATSQHPPARRRPPTPQPARESLFSLGLRIARRWLARTSLPTFTWRLSRLASSSWSSRWRQAQSHRFLFSQSVPL